MINPLVSNPITAKGVLILIGCLLLSVVLNIGFIFFIGRTLGKNIQAAKVEQLQASLASAEQTAAVSTALSKARDEQRDAITNLLAGIADSGFKTNTTYREIVKAAPLPANCVPGSARVEAVNEALIREWKAPKK